MAKNMTQREAEKVLGLTEAYTLADLKACRRRHMVKFHPDKFRNGGSDGLTEAEAQEMFVSGGQAFDTLKILFAGMPADYKVMPASAERASHVPPRSTNPAGDAGDAGFGRSDGTDGTDGTTARSTQTHAHDDADTSNWDFYDWYTAYSEGRVPTDDGSVADDAPETAAHKAPKARKGATRSGDASVPKATRYAYRAENAPDPAPTTGTGGGGCLFWLVLFGGLAGVAIWNQYDPRAAFEFMAGFIVHPERLLVLVGILVFLHVRGK